MNRRVLLAALGLLAAAGIGEASLRYGCRPSPGLARFLFYCQLSTARWSYLAGHRDILITGDEPPRPGPRDHGNDYIEQPETDRPAFDRLAAPYRVVTNEEGYRERPFRPKAAPARWRILALGDSITFGRGVERDDRFTDRLHAALGPQVDVLNLGVPGCTSECMAQVFARHAWLEPDLVILQTTPNDPDYSLWRLAKRHPEIAVGVRLFRGVTRSRTLLDLMYLFAGNRPEKLFEREVAAAGRRYRPSLMQVFAACRRRGTALVVLDLPVADGHRYARPLAGLCRENADVCLGVLTVDFDSPERWLPDWERVSARLRGQPDWVSATARDMRIEESALAPAFPYRYLFQDICHPNAVANLIIAGQLRSFLQAHWGALRMGRRGSTALKESARP